MCRKFAAALNQINIERTPCFPLNKTKCHGGQLFLVPAQHPSLSLDDALWFLGISPSHHVPLWWKQQAMDQSARGWAGTSPPFLLSLPKTNPMEILEAWPKDRSWLELSWLQLPKEIVPISSPWSLQCSCFSLSLWVLFALPFLKYWSLHILLLTSTLLQIGQFLLLALQGR